MHQTARVFQFSFHYQRSNADRVPKRREMSKKQNKKISPNENAGVHPREIVSQLLPKNKKIKRPAWLPRPHSSMSVYSRNDVIQRIMHLLLYDTNPACAHDKKNRRPWGPNTADYRPASVLSHFSPAVFQWYASVIWPTFLIFSR